jgi:hypothetical protein
MAAAIARAKEEVGEGNVGLLPGLGAITHCANHGWTGGGLKEFSPLGGMGARGARGAGGWPEGGGNEEIVPHTAAGGQNSPVQS